MTADSLSEGPAGPKLRIRPQELGENPPSSAGPKGGSVCIKKHTGRRDIGASQKEGDRPALRAAAPTQRGLRTLQPSARASRREGAYPGSEIGKWEIPTQIGAR